MTPAAPPARRPAALKRALLLGCALAGLGGMSGLASGQAFNGTPTTKFGGVAYNRATPGVETVIVTSDTAVIDWQANGTNFLPAGNVATFQNGPSNGDFVVLNRIIFNAPVRFDGTVVSRLVAAVGGAEVGGTVLFSAPNGLIVGGGALFDVGSLVLTTLTVNVDSAGNFYDSAARGFGFSGGGQLPNTMLVTETGARLNALGPNAYVALVGQVIQHGGATRVNGSAAYVAGEEVQFRANQGLFDIIVTTGSDNATPLVHSGSTGGPANQIDSDRHGIYLVAMPKNQAITAVLQGDVGFDPAVSAAIENGEIVLSAGANVVGGQVDRYGDLSGTPAPDQQASFLITGGTVRSDLTGVARTDIIARPAVGQPGLAFQQDVSLYGTRRAHLAVGQGQTLDVLGNAIVSADAFDSIFPGAINLTGGEARIFTEGGGAIHISGTANVDASARGLVDGAASAAGEGQGGSADVTAQGGTIAIDGALDIRATGEGGRSAAVGVDAGAGGFGGTATLAAGVGGTVVAGQTVDLDVSGLASASTGNVPIDGATGAGGTARVLGGPGGTIIVAGTLTATANGTGGEMMGGAGIAGGLGDAGTINIAANGADLDFNGDVVLFAGGQGGNGPLGGLGTGGDINVTAQAGTIDFLGGIVGAATGTGGGGFSGGLGGDGQGGNVLVSANSGAGSSRITGGDIGLSALGQGGPGGNGGLVTPAGSGGAGTGGTVTIVAQSGNGTIQLGGVEADASGIGGDGGSADTNTGGAGGGEGRGGSVLAGTVAGPSASFSAGSATFASLALSATGTGGGGGFGQGGGGTGFGGTVSVSATGAPTVVAGDTNLLADGLSGSAGDSPTAGPGAVGRAEGGVLNVAVANHPSTSAPGTLTLAAVTGTATGRGPTGTGNVAGEWHVSARGGTMLAASMTLDAAAEGTAPGPAPASSIDPQGGTVNVAGTAALGTDGDLMVNASGAGRVIGGRYELVARGDVAMTHGAPPPGANTIDVADLYVRALGDVGVGAGVATRTTNITDIRAMGLATIAGRVAGRQVTIGSADIDVQTGGQIGDSATETVVLDVDGGDNGPLPGGPAPGLGLGASQFTVIGGASQGPGYTLTNAEAGRIRAGTLRILVPALGTAAGRAPDLVLRDVTFTGGGAAAGIGTLQVINANGIARVEGNLLMTGARPQDGIVLNARARLEVVSPVGSVRVQGASGAPGGTLTFASDNIWVASAGLIELLRADPNYAGRDDDLLDNGGSEAPGGYVEAGGVTLSTGGTLYVQNTGSGLPFSTQYAGVTTGVGGLTIVATVPNASVYAFGRRLNADGTSTTGDSFFYESAYEAAAGAGYAPDAAVNTCIIVTGQCPQRFPDNPLPGGEEPFTGPTDGSQAILVGAAEEDDLIDTSFATDAVIEEPVTSGSETNSNICDPEEDGDCDDQPR